jgi:hypothetical protein
MDSASRKRFWLSCQATRFRFGAGGDGFAPCWPAHVFLGGNCTGQSGTGSPWHTPAEARTYLNGGFMRRILCFLVVTTVLTASSGGLFADVTPLSNASKVQLNEVPEAAKNAILAQAGGAPIEDIDRGNLAGKTVYEAAFKQNGQHHEVRVAEDGSLVANISSGQETAVAQATTGGAAQQIAAANNNNNSGDPAYNEGFARYLSNSRKVTWDQVPAEVRKTITKRAQGAAIEDIEVGKGLQGSTIYQAAYKKNGKHVELRVKANGEMLREVADGDAIATGKGTPAAQNPGQNTGQNAGPSFHNALDNAQAVHNKDVPEVLQKIANQHVNRAGAIDYILKGTVNGKTFYHFGYMENGKRKELRVSDDGKFVKEVALSGAVREPAGAQRKR